MAYTRSATHWHSLTDRHGRKVTYITSNECTVATAALVSIHDPQSDLPSRRLVRDQAVGWRRSAFDPECDAPYPEHGLIVYGRSKFDRPCVDEAYDLDRVAADAIMAACNNT